MSLTKPSEFSTFFDLIPKEFRYYVWFFPLRMGKKTPDTPQGTKLKGNETYRMTYHEVLSRLKLGANYGIYALSGGLMFVDFDVDENNCIIASKEYRKQFNETFTVRTRSGGLHLYYLNKGIYPNQLLYENGVKVGELRTDWYYVVGVGSFVGEGQYNILTKTSINNMELSGITGIRTNEEPKSDKIETYKEKSVKVSRDEYLSKIKGKRRVKYEF